MFAYLKQNEPNFGAYRKQSTIYLESGPYILKMVEDYYELLSCFQLRHEVFKMEYKGVEQWGFDFDDFDLDFDHLVVIDKKSEQVIATYRLRTTNQLENSYTAQEFDLSSLTQFSGPFLELGRACVHKDHRKGAAISLLWKGIFEYSTQSQAQIFFGCSSIKGQSGRQAALVYRYLQEQQLISHEIVCEPRDAYSFLELGEWLAQYKTPLAAHDHLEAEGLVPSLLKSYLRLGARIASLPAIDEEFGSLDYLTVLRKSEVSEFLERKFSMRKNKSAELS